MLYRLLKFPATLALRLWVRSLRINKPEFLSQKGPLLIAANHPNSFLDAILIASVFKAPVLSLARGDAFRKPWHGKLLRLLNMLPVYRLSEGSENLDRNYSTFAECIDVFKRGGIVMIFIEGRCINEWKLRPLKKGTARLALDAWSQNIPLRILPTGINYSSFRIFGKDIILNFGEAAAKADFDFAAHQSQGAQIQEFNKLMKAQLEELVLQSTDPAMLPPNALVAASPAVWKKLLFGLPAIAGFILHAPFYYPLKFFTGKKYGNSDHYDSIMLALMFIGYPFWLIAVGAIAWKLGAGYWSFLTVLILPLCGWCYLQLKRP